MGAGLCVRWGGVGRGVGRAGRGGEGRASKGVEMNYTYADKLYQLEEVVESGSFEVGSPAPRRPPPPPHHHHHQRASAEVRGDGGEGPECGQVRPQGRERPAGGD